MNFYGNVVKLVAIAGRGASLAAWLLVMSSSAPVHAQGQPTLSTVATLTNPFTAVLNPRNNKIYAYDGNGDINVVDLAAKTTQVLYQTKVKPPAQRIALNPLTPARMNVYVASGKDLIAIGPDKSVKTLANVVATSSTGITALAGNSLTNQLFVTGDGGDFVQVDGETATIAARMTIKNNPTAIAVNEQDSIVYVSYAGTGNQRGTFSEIKSSTDPATKKVTLTEVDHDWGSGLPLEGSYDPRFNPATNKVYFLTNRPPSYGEIMQLDGPNVWSLGSEDNWIALAVNAVTNRIYAVSADGNLSVFDGFGGAPATINTATQDQGPQRLALNPAADKLYLTWFSGSVSIIDGVNNTVRTIHYRDPNGYAPQQILVNPVTNRAYVVINKSVMEIVEPTRDATNYPADAIEVTQAVQDLAHSIPLIDGKETLVRVYVNPLIAQSGANISGRLTIYRAGAAALTVEPLNTLAYTNASLDDRRTDLTKSLNFVLPGVATGAGRIKIVLTSLTWANGQWTNSNPDGAGDGQARVVTFQPPIDLRVRVVGITYKFGNFEQVEPRDIDYNLIESWLLRAYPVTTLTFSHTTHAGPTQSNGANGTLFSCTDVDTLLTTIRNDDVANGRQDARTRYYGLVYGNPNSTLAAGGTFYMSGCAVEGPAGASLTASGPGGPPGAIFSWDKDSSIADWNAGHELAHTLGSKHAGPYAVLDDHGMEWGPCAHFSGPLNRCTDMPCYAWTTPDHNFPYPQGRMGGANQAFVGYDGGDYANTIPRAALSAPTYHDVMSYCDNVWISDYTYLGIMHQLRRENAP